MSDRVSNIWIIDDDPMSSFYIKRLTELGELASIITIYDKAKGAIDYLLDHKNSPQHLPDVILLDIYMPGMDGWAFVDEFSRIRNLLDKRVYIYIISSSNHPHDIARAEELNEVQDYFQKPVTIEMLNDIVEKVKATT